MIIGQKPGVILEKQTLKKVFIHFNATFYWFVTGMSHKEKEG